jgi:hypothetical protein
LGEQTEFFKTGFEIDFAEVDADKRCVDQIEVFVLKRPANSFFIDVGPPVATRFRTFQRPGGNSPDGPARPSKSRACRPSG